MQKINKHFFAVLLGISLIHFNVRAQNISANARIEPNQIQIGDWLKLYIEVRHTSEITVSFQALPDSFEGFEIVHRDPPSVKQADKDILEISSYTVTSFDSGSHVIPPIPVQYTVAGDTEKRVCKTSPVLVTVRGVAIDTTKDIKDVKPPLSVAISFAELLPYLAAVLLVTAVILLIRYILKKRKKGERILPGPPPRPAHEVALEALRALEAERLWQRGKIKDYHSQLTDILRIYIESRFNIMAMEITSDEILSSLSGNIITKETKEYLKEILIRADLVKFAKLQPLPEENEINLTLAIKFVEETCRPHIEPVKEEIKAEVNA